MLWFGEIEISDCDCDCFVLNFVALFGLRLNGESVCPLFGC